jgi:hypothetical protein
LSKCLFELRNVDGSRQSGSPCFSDDTTI